MPENKNWRTRWDHGLGSGETDQSLVLGGFLAFHGVDAAVPALETLGADLLDVVVDDLEVDLGVVPQLHGLRGQFCQTALLGKIFRPNL